MVVCGVSSYIVRISMTVEEKKQPSSTVQLFVAHLLDYGFDSHNTIPIIMISISGDMLMTVN